MVPDGLKNKLHVIFLEEWRGDFGNPHRAMISAMMRAHDLGRADGKAQLLAEFGEVLERAEGLSQ